MANYFSTNIPDADTLKKEYRRLAMRYHPDLGGDVKIMQFINAEYAYLKKRFEPGFTGDFDDRGRRPGQAKSKQEQPKQKPKSKTRAKAKSKKKAEPIPFPADHQWAYQQLNNLFAKGYFVGCEFSQFWYPDPVFDGLPCTQVMGNTFPYKDILKNLGFRWSPEERLWYFYFRQPIGYDADQEPAI